MARGPYPAIVRIAKACEKIFGVPVNGDYVIYPAIVRIAQALEASKIENIDDVIDELKNKPYISLNRLGAYLYEVTYGKIADPLPTTSVYTGGCSSFVRDGKLHRNLDWTYDNTAEFKVITKDFVGMSFINGLNDSELNDTLIGQLPYHVNDGVNKHGIMVSTHVLFNDWEFTGSGTKDKELTQLPYYILTHLNSLTDINTVLSDYLANIKVSDGLARLGYLVQFMVTDGTTTYAILPPEDADSTYEIVDITANPKLTNFRWVNKATVDRDDADLQTRPTGVERWNEIEDANVQLSDLRFTKAYESPVRLSEFIGLRDTTKESTDEELEAIYDIAHDMYLTRERDGSLWQTCHSVVYGEKNIESLFVQEDYVKNYGNVLPSGFAQILDIIPPQASEHNQLADKAFVAESVQSASANYRGVWDLWAEVPSNPELYPLDYNQNRKPGPNDYMVIADVISYWPEFAETDTYNVGDIVTHEGNTYSCILAVTVPGAWDPDNWEEDDYFQGTWRFKYSGDWDVNGKDGWDPEYQINANPLTSAQVAALNSGITSALVEQIIAHMNNTNIHITALEKQSYAVKETTITAAANATVNGSSVPYLTDVQIIEAYNKHIANMPVVVKDAFNKYYHLFSANMIEDSGEVTVTLNFLFNDKMILTYTANNEVAITFKELAAKPIVIAAETTTSVEGYAVPSLTKAQVEQAYDAIAAGNSVYIKDSFDSMLIPVIEINSMLGKAIKLFFNGILVLNYMVSGNNVAISVINNAGAREVTSRTTVTLLPNTSTMITGTPSAISLTLAVPAANIDSTYRVAFTAGSNFQFLCLAPENYNIKWKDGITPTWRPLYTYDVEFRSLNNAVIGAVATEYPY